MDFTFALFSINVCMVRSQADHFSSKSILAYYGLKNDLPSTNEVSKVTFAALRLPAGNASPILSNLSLRYLPPFFDLALKKKTKKNNFNEFV